MFARKPRFMYDDDDEDFIFVIPNKSKKGKPTSSDISPRKMTKFWKDLEELRKVMHKEEKKEEKKDEKKGINPHVLTAILCVASFVIGPMWFMMVVGIAKKLGML